MVAVAFKEWAVICRALGEGRQALILRKGGIAETGGQFRPEHDRFLLYPTFFHEQQQKGITPDLFPLLTAAEADRPSPGVVRFAHVVTVASVHLVTDLDRTFALQPLHIWSADTVRQRFHYRSPGLYVLTVRAYQLTEVADWVERPEYAGCKTWVELDTPVSDAGATPVMPDAAFAEYAQRVSDVLGVSPPTG